MRITITQILPSSTSNVKVKFLTKSGVGEAFWGSRNTPQLNHTYDVEIEVRDILNWGKTIYFCSPEADLVEIKANQLLLRGKLESLEQDGSAILRIDDSIILLETKGDVIRKDSFICVLSNNVFV